MLDRIWEILKSSQTLIDEAWRDAESMLTKCQQMYEMVTRALREETSDQVLLTVANMDREVNDHQREVRKKVFQQLAVGRGGDLLSGLQLMSIVIDLERIGDYTKNIGELPQYLKGSQDFADYSAAYDEVHDTVTKMFDLTREALSQRSEDKGKAAMDLYPAVSRLCDATTRDILTSGGEDSDVERAHVGLLLLLRYKKRVAAHLKNACSAIVNPIHQVGFRDGLT